MKLYCTILGNGSEYHVIVYLIFTDRSSLGAFPSKTQLRLDCCLVMKVSLRCTAFTAGNFAHMVLTDLDAEEEKATRAETKEKFKPLLNWLRIQAEDVVRDGSHCVSLSFSCISDLIML